jgi:hypothetical protein
MNQIDKLYAFLKANLPERLMSVAIGADAWMDDIQLIHAAKNWGLGQRRIMIRRYSATLAWERWPYRLHDPDIPFALVGAWLIEHANAHYNGMELEPPEVFTQLMNNGDAIITITVPLADDIILVEDAKNGVIPLQGKRYSLADAQVNVATKGWVYGAGGRGAPVEVTGDAG